MLKIYSMDIKTEKFDADELETELNVELLPIELEETNPLLDESQKEGESEFTSINHQAKRPVK